MYDRYLMFTTLVLITFTNFKLLYSNYVLLLFTPCYTVLTKTYTHII